MREPARPLSARPPARPQFDVGAANNLPRSSTVLLLVDVINPMHFPEAPALVPPALRAAQAIRRLKQKLSRRRVATIYANDNYGVWRSNFQELIAYCTAQPGPVGRIAQLLTPDEDDVLVLKPRQSAFFATPLDLVLSQMHTRRLIVVGYATDICVQLTAMDAQLRGYELWVPSDCTAAESPAIKKASLNYLQRVLKADIKSSTSP